MALLDSILAYLRPPDPWAASNAELAQQRLRNWNVQPAVPMAGMLNEMGTLNLPQSGLPNAGEAIPMPQPKPLTIEGPAPPEFNPGTVPLPQARPISAPQSPAIPPAARPAAAPPPQPSFFDRLQNNLGSHAATLLALGAGFSGAPSFGQGMSRAFGAAAPASQMDLARNMRLQGIQQTYKALVAQGVLPGEALAAVYNPEVLKAMIPRLYGKAPTWGAIGQDEKGLTRYGFIDPYTQTVLPSSQVTKPQVRSFEDALRLPKGTHFIDPNGIERIR